MSDNIKTFPVEKVDRVVKLAKTLSEVLALSERPPEDLMAALLLVQVALQQTIVEEGGPRELQRVLIAANERRRRYNAIWSKKDGD